MNRASTRVCLNDVHVYHVDEMLWKAGNAVLPQPMARRGHTMTNISPCPRTGHARLLLFGGSGTTLYTEPPKPGKTSYGIKPVPVEKFYNDTWYAP